MIEINPLSCTGFRDHVLRELELEEYIYEVDQKA